MANTLELSSFVSDLPLVGPTYTKKLEKLSIVTIEDLLHHIPTRYKDFRKISPIRGIRVGESVTIEGKLESIRNVFTKNGKRMQIAVVSDATGTMQCIWFNQIYLVRNFVEGETYSFSGSTQFFNRKVVLISPDYEKIEAGKDKLHTGRLIAVYSETAGISSKWLRSKINFVRKNLDHKLTEYLPDELLVKEGFPVYKEAISNVHTPEHPEEVASSRNRLAFNELLMEHLKSLYRKNKWQEKKVSFRLKVDDNIISKFIRLYPYKLTDSQLTSIKELSEDLKKEIPMNRLLQGDVGSGKTVIAQFMAFTAFANGYQSIIMAPTQILAKQHYENFINIFSPHNVRVSLLTSSQENIHIGKSDIFIGTHSLIYKKFEKAEESGFSKVACVVIDEQHRFGVEQREQLIKKAKSGKHIPNLLTMTATPIPRTIALTLYGDLDLSVLTEMPKGRQPITTWIVPDHKKINAHKWIGEKIKKEKVQAYFICPLIEESLSESMKQVKAAKEEYEELIKMFPGLSVGLLHGKMKVKEKNDTLDNFRQGAIDVLVATPVVEVGIDVPNATIMVIEAGERYGLAQLHQLRGRIGRGTKKSYCLVFSNNTEDKTKDRLTALTKSISGFELAELDLKLRGPGDIFGSMQHGFPELRIANWSDSDLILKTRKYAEEIMNNPEKYPLIIDKISSKVHL